MRFCSMKYESMETASARTEGPDHKVRKEEIILDRLSILYGRASGFIDRPTRPIRGSSQEWDSATVRDGFKSSNNQ
jgi:hypothetical protein